MDGELGRRVWVPWGLHRHVGHAVLTACAVLSRSSQFIRTLPATYVPACVLHRKYLMKSRNPKEQKEILLWNSLLSPFHIPPIFILNAKYCTTKLDLSPGKGQWHILRTSPSSSNKLKKYQKHLLVQYTNAKGAYKTHWSIMKLFCTVASYHTILSSRQHAKFVMLVGKVNQRITNIELKQLNPNFLKLQQLRIVSSNIFDFSSVLFKKCRTRWWIVSVWPGTTQNTTKIMVNLYHPAKKYHYSNQKIYF